MYRNFLILILFLGAGAMEPIFGSSNYKIDKSSLQTLIDEDAKEIYIKFLLNKIPHDEGVGILSSLFITNDQALALQTKNYFFRLKSLVGYQIKRPPLFLLFHVFLFYDLL